MFAALRSGIGSDSHGAYSISMEYFSSRTGPYAAHRRMCPCFFPYLNTLTECRFPGYGKLRMVSSPRFSGILTSRTGRFHGP